MHRVNFVWMVLCVTSLGQILCAQTTPANGTERVLIGILDDAREEMVNWKPGVAEHRLVRPAFEKTGAGWHKVKFGTIPARMKWTVAFDGKSLGEITSQTVLGLNGPVWWRPEYLTKAQAIVTPANAIPSVGVPSGKYAGLGEWDGPSKGRRPLVLVSKPFVSDPDGWKRISQVTDAIDSIVRAAFRRDFPNVARCKNEEIVQRNWKYPDSSLKLVTIYASNRDSFLIQTSLNAGDCGYVDDPNDPLSEPWFFVSNDGQARRIGSFLSLLDAGDYDNDGRSELIFILEQPEDTEGFVLYDAELRKQASLLWTYH